MQLKKDEGNQDPGALSGMLEAIDQGSTDSVYVMAVEDGEDIAGMGGLMGTAMAARGYAGAVIDGGVRDVAYLRKIGFPVFATGIVPSTSVHHYRFAGAQVPLVCNGVPVVPGILSSRIAMAWWWCLERRRSRCSTLAQQMDFKEHSMYAVIEQLKSIVRGRQKVRSALIPHSVRNSVAETDFHQIISAFIFERDKSSPCPFALSALTTLQRSSAG